METTTITYQAIHDLAFFQEQYERLTHDIQQARIQLENSPALPPDDPRSAQRDEWRSWLQIQITSKCRERDATVEAIAAKGFTLIDLPD